MAERGLDENTQKAVAESLQAISRIDPQQLKTAVEAVQNVTRAWDGIASQIAQSLVELSKTLQPTLEALNATLFAPNGFIARMAEQGRAAKLLDGSGWLPHYTTPFEIISDPNLQLADVDEILSEFYRTKWSQAAKKFNKRLDDYAIDDEAKETFREALKAHARGFYRVAPRLLFPEIERIGADEFHDGEHRVTSGGKKFGIASLKEIRNAMEKLPAGSVAQYEQGFALFKKMQEHIYRTLDGPDDIVRASFDPVPNRHASLHGIIRYNSQKSSINSIIMTDFIFYLVDQLKMYIELSDNEGED